MIHNSIPIFASNKLLKLHIYKNILYISVLLKHFKLMTNNFAFHTEEIEKAVANFNSVLLAPEQKIIVENFAKILNSFISVNELALKGFINQAIVEWQKETNISIASLAQSTPEKRIEAVGTMFMKLFKKLSSILKHNNEADKLKTAINKAFDFYKKEFAYR